MWPNTALCDLLGIEHPIIQAPMVGSCSPALASAVGEAGGLGSLGCGVKPTNQIRDEVDALRRSSNRPFNLNFFITETAHTPDDVLEATRARIAPWYDKLDLGEPPRTLSTIGPCFDDERLELVLTAKPAVASFHFGAPDADAIAQMKSAGVVLISTATTVAEATDLEAAGMDAIVAQGYEAGGHRGSHPRTEPGDGVGTMALTPQIVDAVSVPVIAAGGIGDARGVAAAFSLGAAGVQLGTAFLSCPEAATDAARRRYLKSASETDTIVTDAYSGRSARGRRSRFAEEMTRLRTPMPDFLHMYDLTNPIRQAADDDEASFLLYGQAARLNREEPAAELVDRLVRECREIFGRLGAAAR